MNKNILIISSSPRKGGNSDLLCDELKKGTEEMGHCAEKISLREKKINYCTGCGTCINGNNGCPQKDDMKEILEKMISSDVIVMATPVYFYTMCAQMKTLIDRSCARYTEIRNKDFYFILTAADGSKKALERTVEEFRGFLFCLNGAKEKEIIWGTGAWNKGDIKNSVAMKNAYEIGKNI
jgi:multimeric flavodoxin WrbA